jgi:hypothetical protein
MSTTVYFLFFGSVRAARLLSFQCCVFSFSFVCRHPVCCVPNVISVSRLYILYWPNVTSVSRLYILDWPNVTSVSRLYILDCPVFSNVYIKLTVESHIRNANHINLSRSHII